MSSKPQALEDRGHDNPLLYVEITSKVCESAIIKTE